ncbi:MAG: hypothetical protein ACRDPU_11090, partial [Thermoleophilia bacterium]
AAQEKEAGQTADQLPGRLLQPGGGGQLDRGQQVGPFQLEPGQGSASSRSTSARPTPRPPPVTT